MATDLPHLDSHVTQLSSDIRDDLAERGKNDLFFLAKGILGYRDMSLNCHGPLCQYLDHHDSRFKLVLMPRGHFKTSLCTIGRVTQKVIRDPNQRVLLANETSTNAQRFMSAIKQQFESNPVMRALYSDIIPKDTRKNGSWSSTELTLVRQWMGPEPTIDTGGMTGALTSRHYTHITVDDPISEEAAKSAAVMQDTITRIDKFFSLMVKPDLDTFDLIGTRWALYDVYSYFQKVLGTKMARFIRASIGPDGQPIFPELISLDTLAQIRAQIGEYMFSCLYQNNPRDVANQDFNIADLKFWRWSSDEESVVLYNHDGTINYVEEVQHLDITTSVDLAVAEKITSDRNAIVTCGVTRRGDVVVLDAWARRCTPLEVIEHLLWLRKRYAIRAVGIEGVVYQKAFKYFLKAECERRNVYMNIIELKAVASKRGTGSNSKEMRIRGLQPIAATGHMYILPTQHILRNELADFPLGEHDDVADALAHQLTMWRGIMSPERWMKYQQSEQALFRRMDQLQMSAAPTESWLPTRRGEGPHPDDIGLDEVPQFGPVGVYELRN